MTILNKTLPIWGGAFAAALLVVACDSATKPGDGALSQAQADTVADVMASQADGLAEGAAYGGPASPSVDFFASALPRGVAFPFFSRLCTPTRSPNPPVNSDGDEVPDSVRVDFTGCSLSTTHLTIDVSGMIDFVDPTPTATDIGLKTRYLAFTRSVTYNDKTRSVKQNGVRLVIHSADKLQVADSSFKTDYTFFDGTTASHLLNWSSLFTPDAPAVVMSNSFRGWSLPSGTWSINGTSTFTHGDKSYALSVATSPPLHFNASCTMAPRFDAGTLKVVVTKNGTTTTVTVAFTACGQYTVTRS
ncbi:MAG TPA: hypothetical protein VLV16_13500 [Gemmatimonadales bacterium]|nr:hypothetical protein [Gemmatimonadales bacterium]